MSGIPDPQFPRRGLAVNPPAASILAKLLFLPNAVKNAEGRWLLQSVLPCVARRSRSRGKLVRAASEPLFWKVHHD